MVSGFLDFSWVEYFNHPTWFSFVHYSLTFLTIIEIDHYLVKVQIAYNPFFLVMVMSMICDMISPLPNSNSYVIPHFWEYLYLYLL